MGFEKDPQRSLVLVGQFADGAKGRRPFRVGGEGAMQRLGSHLVHREILAVKGVAPRAEAGGDKLVRPLLQGLPVGFDRDVFAHRLRLAVHHGLAGPGGGQQLAQRRNESLAVAAGGQERVFQDVGINVAGVIAVGDSPAEIVLQALAEAAARVEGFGHALDDTGTRGPTEVLAAREAIGKPVRFVFLPVDDGLRSAGARHGLAI